MICRNCGAGLEAGGIDTSLGVVTCSHCGSLHDIPDSGPEPLSTSEADIPSKPKAAKKRERLEVALPGKFQLRRGAASMEVTWSVGRMFSALVLSIIAGGFAYVAVTSGMLPLLIASAGILYYAAIQAFNKHRIRVDGARLHITQGPLPCPGTHKLDASDIVQLFARQHESRVETGQKSNRRVEVRKHYSLSANTNSRGRITILKGLSDPHQALWLEQEIERLLGIVDKRVAGEHAL